MKCPWCEGGTLTETLEEKGRFVIVTVKCSRKKCKYLEMHVVSKEFLARLGKKPKRGV